MYLLEMLFSLLELLLIQQKTTTEQSFKGVLNTLKQSVKKRLRR
jgi:hypothetical protein